ncbi:MAG TPA: right-handed parallel beta-helix repeat-containing protein [Rhodopila sp.]
MVGSATPRPRPTHYLTSDGLVVRARPRSIARRLVRLLVVVACLGGVAGAATAGVILSHLGRTPREWAPYLQRRAAKHRPLIVNAADLVARWLIYADRLAPPQPFTLPAFAGATVSRSGIAPPGRLRVVASLPALAEAAATAEPGDVIQLEPGHYRFGGYSIKFNRPGTADAPITLRAATLDGAVVESDASETFNVSAPFWRFENLSMRGVCGNHSDCEHAIHVVGGATDVVIRNNRFRDYNAHIKVNGEGGRFPDRGVIEGNTLTDTAPRSTDNPVTPIDLVAASNWLIRGNVIADFVRADGGKVTYGAFVKGAGEANIIERNVVICEWKLRNVAGQRVGLSLGGGGTDDYARREQGHSGFEQTGGIIRDNLIASCDDDGIYLNRAARSVIDHNTLLDTAGIDARFVETSASVTANIVDGVIRARDAAALRVQDNQAAYLLELFAGVHPQRGYFSGPNTLDLTWRREPERRLDASRRVDLCGHPRSVMTSPGAFEDYGFCLVSGGSGAS